MAGIFINYRREDSSPYAGRLFDRLARDLGSDLVFMDIDAIEPGEDFVESIERRLESCNAALVLIGKTWLTCVDQMGARRLDNPDDYVRRELAAALARKIRVIPVLVGGATMPRADQLPAELTPVCRRNAIEITDIRFHQDVDRLVTAVRKVLGQALDQPGLPGVPAAPSVGSESSRSVADQALAPLPGRPRKDAADPVISRGPGPAQERVPDVAARQAEAPTTSARLMDIGLGVEHVLRAHTKPVMSVAFSPDGRLLASGGGGVAFSGDTVVRLWRVSDGKLLRELQAHRSQVTRVAFAPGGDILASASVEAIRLWQIEDGARLHTLEPSVGECIAFSPDGRVLASGQKFREDSGLHLWRVADGKHLRRLGAAKYKVSDVAFSPDGNVIGAVSDDGLRLWRAADGELLEHVEGTDAFVHSISFSPDGTMLATPWLDKTRGTLLVLRSVPQGRELCVLSDPSVPGAQFVAFSPDGLFLATTPLMGQEICLWRIADGKCVLRLKLPDFGFLSTNTPHGVAFSPDGAWLAAACEDKLVRLWPVRITQPG